MQGGLGSLGVVGELHTGTHGCKFGLDKGQAGAQNVPLRQESGFELHAWKASKLETAESREGERYAPMSGAPDKGEGSGKPGPQVPSLSAQIIRHT